VVVLQRPADDGVSAIDERETKVVETQERHCPASARRLLPSTSGSLLASECSSAAALPYTLG
jgi:hypothetical protein